MCSEAECQSVYAEISGMAMPSVLHGPDRPFHHGWGGVPETHRQHNLDKFAGPYNVHSPGIAVDY